MWNYKLKTEIEFGNGAIEKLKSIITEYDGSGVWVTDKIIRGLPVVNKLISSTGNFPVFDEVRPNPTVENVDRLAELIDKNNAQFIIVIGGGSSIDCAKAASFLAKSGEKSIRKFHFEKQQIGNVHLPVIAVPTTAGTGSEVTPFAVLDDTEKNFKGPIASESFYPVKAIVDPELTYSVPLKVTAVTALDALSHAIEGYWSKNHLPLCDLMAKEAAKKIFAHLENVLKNPNDKDGREALSYAALLAGMAFQIPKNAIMHACSFPLSNRFHIAHGAACAFTMEASIRLNTPHMNGRMEEFAEYCGFDNVGQIIDRILELKKIGGLPCTLAEAGIEKKDVELLIKESFHPLMNNNPKKVSIGDLKKIYADLEN
jgi:sulfoacetaldehyde reductase (NADH)